ncbi:MAG: HIT family protein [Myxococcota bacterium]|nr:HIT family protein [Myxococcota bacterium]
MNETARKFGHPDTLLHELDHWAVLLRPAQVTLGSLVLVCKEPATRFAEIGAPASGELVTAVSNLERVLADAFAFDKINYLMLMMVDPDVHFHVIPRYAEERSFAGKSFVDAFWPGPPDVTRALDFDDAARSQMIAELGGRFAALASGGDR